MPKERFHLLVAEQLLTALSNSPPATESQRRAYLWGAISPDVLFYDLPSFRCTPAAAALHRMEGLAAVEFLRALMTDGREALTPETRRWLLGVGTHLLVDGFWHPIIGKYSSFDCRHVLPGSPGLSERQTHHWLESELEGFWLVKAGPAGGYRQLLKDFGKPQKAREEFIGCLQEILRRLGTVDVPDAGRIGRCFSWQTFLLGQFSRPIWARWRDPLLRFRATRFWGTLIVPEAGGLSSFPASRTPANGRCRDLFGDLFSDRLMARSLSFLTNHLPSLAAQL